MRGTVAKRLRRQAEAKYPEGGREYFPNEAKVRGSVVPQAIGYKREPRHAYYKKLKKLW